VIVGHKNPPILSFAWLLANSPANEQEKVARFNPRPAGVIREGSASDAVLKFLRESGGFKTEAQILWAVRRTHSSVSWSLLFLVRNNLVESRPDSLRSSRYKKYRAVRPEE